jgi:hypothetical protein
MMMPLGLVILLFGWISAGMREHEEEFRQAWLQRFGDTPSARGGVVPPATYKAWYKQFKKTGVRPADWLSTLAQGPPSSSQL